LIVLPCIGRSLNHGKGSNILKIRVQHTGVDEVRGGTYKLVIYRKTSSGQR
jgi:hypothetical protein